MMTGDEPAQFDWSELVPQVIHPIRVAIIEALLWVDCPLSSSDLNKVFDDEFSLSRLSYHVGVLARGGVLKEVSHRNVRGARETFYFFPAAAQFRA